MILDQLISAYLDGDLSAEQDRELREHVRRDPVAREAFDTAVLIHIAMRCEDETVPPQHLRSGVFDAVDAMAAENGLRLQSRPTVRSPRRLRFAATLAVLILTFWLPIRDGAIEQLTATAHSPQLTARSNSPQLTATAHSSQLTATAHSSQLAATAHSSQLAATAHSSQLTATAHSSQLTATAHSSQQQPTANSSQLTATAHSNSNSQTPDIPLSTLFGALSAQTMSSVTPVEDASATATERPQPMIAHEAPLQVSVATTYAAGVSSTLASAQDLRQISASVAYGLSARDAIGLEIGTTSYSVEQSSAVITTSDAFSSTMRTSVNDGAGSEKLASPEVIREEYGRGQMQRTAVVHTGWGTAFYERSLIASERLGLTGRAGIGASDSGFLGFGRLTGSLDLGSGFSVMLGAEARAMPFQTGAGSAVSSQITYGTVLTALTGLRVRF